MREKFAQAIKNHPQTVMVALVLRLLSWSGLAIAHETLPCLDSSKECVEQLTEKAIAHSAKLKTLDDRIALIDKRLGVLTDYLILTLFEGGSGKLLTVTVE